MSDFHQPVSLWTARALQTQAFQEADAGLTYPSVTTLLIGDNKASPISRKDIFVISAPISSWLTREFIRKPQATHRCQSANTSHVRYMTHDVHWKSSLKLTQLLPTKKPIPTGDIRCLLIGLLAMVSCVHSFSAGSGSYIQVLVSIQVDLMACTTGTARHIAPDLHNRRRSCAGDEESSLPAKFVEYPFADRGNQAWGI